MGWKDLKSQQQGNIGLGQAIAYFTSKGYIVSLPLNDCQDYDLVVEMDGVLKRVQVKTTRCVDGKGDYICTLKSSGGTAGKIYHTVVDSVCELLFIVTESLSRYLIPVESLNSRSSLTLGKLVEKYKV